MNNNQRTSKDSPSSTYRKNADSPESVKDRCKKFAEEEYHSENEFHKRFKQETDNGYASKIKSSLPALRGH